MIEFIFNSFPSQHKIRDFEWKLRVCEKHETLIYDLLCISDLWQALYEAYSKVGAVCFYLNIGASQLSSA